MSATVSLPRCGAVKTSHSAVGKEQDGTLTMLFFAVSCDEDENLCVKKALHDVVRIIIHHVLSGLYMMS